MKNLFFFLLLCATVSFSSCSKDDDATADFITATIDGSTFEATTITAIGDSDLGDLLIFIVGKDDNDDRIGLNIPGDSQLNSNFQIDANDLALTFTDANSNAFFTVGQVTITKHDSENKQMEGNFNFTATQDGDPTNVRTITNGSFKVTYL